MVLFLFRVVQMLAAILSFLLFNHELFCAGFSTSSPPQNCKQNWLVKKKYSLPAVINPIQKEVGRGEIS